MNNKIPTEEEILDLFSRIQPRPNPRLNHKIAKQPWNRKGHSSSWIIFTPIKAVATIGLVMLLVFGISLLSPSLNTLAQRFTHFFSPSPKSQVSEAIAPLETSHPLERFNLTISEAEKLAGFPMKTPPKIPQGFRLIGATYDELREAIILHYTTNSEGLVIRISQQQVDSDFQGIGSEAEVEIVSVGLYIGEFVAGGWMIPEVESVADATLDPIAPSVIWNENVNLQILRWSDGEYLYEIIQAGGLDQPGYLNKDGLIDLASQMH